MNLFRISATSLVQTLTDNRGSTVFEYSERDGGHLDSKSVRRSGRKYDGNNMFPLNAMLTTIAAIEFHLNQILAHIEYSRSFRVNDGVDYTSSEGYYSADDKTIPFTLT